jgi:hypothetical protein
MHAGELVIKENMCFSRRDFNTSTINLFPTLVEMSVLVYGQNIIYNYSNYFKEDYYV